MGRSAVDDLTFHYEEGLMRTLGAMTKSEVEHYADVREFYFEKWLEELGRVGDVGAEYELCLNMQTITRRAVRAVLGRKK